MIQGETGLDTICAKKPRKWGIKIWTLADAANGYVSNMKVYTGKLE